MIKEGKKRITITIDEEILKEIEIVKSNHMHLKDNTTSKWIEKLLDFTLCNLKTYNFKPILKVNGGKK